MTSHIRRFASFVAYGLGLYYVFLDRSRGLTRSDLCALLILLCSQQPIGRLAHLHYSATGLAHAGFFSGHVSFDPNRRPDRAYPGKRSAGLRRIHWFAAATNFWIICLFVALASSYSFQRAAGCAICLMRGA